MNNDGVEVIVDSYGNKHWYLNGKRHRTDGPAVEQADGYKAWYLNGKPHRTDGPAVEGANGYKVWYLNGEEIDEFIFWFTTLERQAAHEQ